MEIIGTAVDGVGVCIVAAGALVARRASWCIACTTKEITIRLIGRTSDAQFYWASISDCRRYYPNRSRRAHNSKCAYFGTDRAHPHVPELVAPTGNRREVAVAPRRSRPRLRLIFPSRKQRALVTASRQQWLNCSNIGRAHCTQQHRQTTAQRAFSHSTYRKAACTFSGGHFASERIGFHTFCSGASEHASAFCSI